MKAHLLAASLLLGAVVPLGAQAPCATKRVVVDSALTDVFTVLGGEGRLVDELRREQGLSAESLNPVPVNDPVVCTRMAAAFNRIIAPSLIFAVVRVGNVYYARDPDQKRATGVITDTTYRVLMRLGAEIPPPRKPGKKP